MKYFLSSIILAGGALVVCSSNASKQLNQSASSTLGQKPAVQRDTTKKYIFLTFDDGPQKGTETVYNIIKNQNIKATFFMVGLHSKIKSDGKELANTIKQSYPQTLLANHSYSHAYDKYFYFYHHPQMAMEDFLHSQQLLSIPYKIVRLPGNSAWVRNNEIKASQLVKPVCKLLDSAGYNVIGWDVEWSFNHKTQTPVQTPFQMLKIVDNALARENVHTKNCVVILSHDRMFRNANYADSLNKFIGLLKQHPNYVFETVDHYPNLKPMN